MADKLNVSAIEGDNKMDKLDRAGNRTSNSKNIIYDSPASFAPEPDWLKDVALYAILPLALVSLVENIAVLHTYSQELRLRRTNAFFVLNMTACDFILVGFSMPFYVFLTATVNGEYIGLVMCAFLITVTFIATDVFVTSLLLYVIICFRRIYTDVLNSSNTDFQSKYIKGGVLSGWFISVSVNLLQLDAFLPYEDFCLHNLPASIHGHVVFILIFLFIIFVIGALFATPIIKSTDCRGLVSFKLLFTYCTGGQSWSSQTNTDNERRYRKSMAAFVERVKRPPPVLEKSKYDRCLYCYARFSLQAIPEMPLMEEKENTEKQKTEMERGEKDAASTAHSGVFRAPGEGIHVRQSISHSSRERERRSRAISFQGEKAQEAISELLLTPDGRDRVDGIPQELRKHSVQQLRSLHDAFDPAPNSDRNFAWQAEDETPLITALNTNKSSNTEKDGDTPSQRVYFVTRPRHQKHGRRRVWRASDGSRGDQIWEIATPSSCSRSSVCPTGSDFKDGNYWDARLSESDRLRRLKCSSKGGRISVIDTSNKHPPFKLNKRSLLLFRELVTIVMATVVTWCPLCVYVILKRSWGKTSYQMFTSPTHAALHVIAWTRPFFLAAIHLFYRNLN